MRPRQGGALAEIIGWGSFCFWHGGAAAHLPCVGRGSEESMKDMAPSVASTDRWLECSDVGAAADSVGSDDNDLASESEAARLRAEPLCALLSI